MKVENLVSIVSDRPVANQFIIRDNQDIYFQSYRSIIAKVDKNNKVSLDKKYYKYSKTTGKYRNQFLGETLKETEAKIKAGEYKLVNLN